jgi:site-specific recombinase XerD
LQHIPFSQKGAHHDSPSATHDRRHAGAESRPEYETSYLQQVSLFARHFHKSPEELGPEEIRSYQVYLTNEKKLAPGSILIAVAALRFLYKVSLKRDWPFDDAIPAPKKPQKLPVVLSPEEVLHFLEGV